MQNADALLEICTELCLLAHFSDKVIDQNLLNDHADLASLFYGLKAASCQARHVITHQFPEHQLIQNGEEEDDVRAGARVGVGGGGEGAPDRAARRHPRRTEACRVARRRRSCADERRVMM